MTTWREACDHEAWHSPAPLGSTPRTLLAAFSCCDGLRAPRGPGFSQVKSLLMVRQVNWGTPMGSWPKRVARFLPAPFQRAVAHRELGNALPCAPCAPVSDPAHGPAHGGVGVRRGADAATGRPVREHGARSRPCAAGSRRGARPARTSRGRTAAGRGRAGRGPRRRSADPAGRPVPAGGPVPENVGRKGLPTGRHGVRNPRIAPAWGVALPALLRHSPGNFGYEHPDGLPRRTCAGIRRRRTLEAAGGQCPYRPNSAGPVATAVRIRSSGAPAPPSPKTPPHGR